MRGLLSRVLAEVDLFLMQSAPHAERARQIGLVWDVVPVEKLTEEAVALFRRALAEAPADAPWRPMAEKRLSEAK